jgi:glutamate-1-semialdehyde 2,1-aminomutase
VIGGGLPIGAFGGRADVMGGLAPLGPVFQAGTLSGNPLATAAGLAALGLLDDEAYERIEKTATRLADGLRDALRTARIPSTVPQFTTLLGLHFSAVPAVDHETAKLADKARFASFFHAMLRRGIALSPGSEEILFPGLAHDEHAVEKVVDAAAEAANEIA